MDWHWNCVIYDYFVPTQHIYNKLKFHSIFLKGPKKGKGFDQWFITAFTCVN